MASEPRPQSPRLGYRRPGAADVDVLHAIITDDHVKRYLCDGQTLPREWAVDTIQEQEKCDRRGDERRDAGQPQVRLAIAR